MTLEQKLHRAQQHLDAAYDLEPHLTSRQYVVLSCLTECNGISQTKIVEETCIDRSTTASMIAQLVRRGLVSRQRSRTDSRAYVVSVTAAGRAAVKADRKALAALNQDQRIALMAALDAIAG